MSSQSTTTATNKPTAATQLVQTRVINYWATFPWWGLILALLGVLLVFNFATNARYQDIITYLMAGIRLTVIVTLISFGISLLIGLITAFAQMSQGTGIVSVMVRNIATLYVQIIRGIPVIVLIFYTALVIVPAGIDLLNAFGDWLANIGLLAAENSLSTLTSRGVSFVIRGIIALAINYGAFSSEVFRAGIQSIEKGQLEASRALGLNWTQMMRYVVMPQAIRRILPPMGNDFISMLKESSLVSVLGVGEITQLGKKYSAASFLYPQTYNTVAFLYLSMTLILSMGVKYMEQRMATGEER